MGVSDASVCYVSLCVPFPFHLDLAVLWRPRRTLAAYTFPLPEEVVSWEEVVEGRVGVGLVCLVPCRRFQSTVRV